MAEVTWLTITIRLKGTIDDDALDAVVAQIAALGFEVVSTEAEHDDD